MRKRSRNRRKPGQRVGPLPGMAIPEQEVAVHVIAHQHFERALRAFNLVLEEFETRDDPIAKDIREKSSDLRKAMQSLLDERKLVRGSQEKSDTGAEDGQELDLDAVRAALLERMARLRDG